MESTPEEAAEGLAIVRVLAAVLDRLVCANSHLARAEPAQVTKFHALKAPGIAIQQYLERIHKYAACSSQCFIMALIYIDRLIQRNNFLLTELNVHRVIVTAILLAAKFFDDAYYNNAYYAKVGGVLVSEMNGLEVDFLFRINFSLHVTPDLFEQYRAELLSHLGTESLPVPSPPPQPVYHPHRMEQQSMVPIQSENYQQQQQNFQQQQQQQQPAINAFNGLSFPINAVNQAPVSAPPPQITPSPPAPTTRTSSTSFSKPMFEDEVMAAVDEVTIRSNLPNLFPNEFGFLQRANSLPVQPKSLADHIQNSQPQPLPLSAPPMMPMMPGNNNDQFVVLENQVYHLPSAGMFSQSNRDQQAAAAAAAATAAAAVTAAAVGRVLDASELIHHVHNNPSAAASAGLASHLHHHHHHNVPGFISREAAVSQRFAATQMVAGVSGGS